MGCFSYKCKECGKGVRSTSFSGEKVKIFLLNKGKVIQQMEGQYDSYGGVFIEGTQDKSVPHALKLSQEWKKVDPKKSGDAWSQVCDLLFSHKNDTGFAYVHSKCFKKVPTTVSESDPNQGWGGDDEECLMGNTDSDHDFDK